MGEFVPQIREGRYPVHRLKRPFDPVGSTYAGSTSLSRRNAGGAKAEAVWVLGPCP